MPVLLTREAEWDDWLYPGADLGEPRQSRRRPICSKAVPVTRDLLRIKKPTAAMLTPVTSAG